MTSVEWLQFLLSYSLQAAIVIGVAFGLDRWAHRCPTVQSRVWTACYVSVLGVLAAGLLLPRLHLFHPWKDVPTSGLLMTAEVESVLGRALLAIWLLGVGVMLVRAVIDFIRVQRFIATCPSCTTEEADRMHSLVPAETFVIGKQIVHVRVSPEDLGPFCYQFHRPLVFIPQSLIAGDETDLRHILDHELTHLRTEHPLQLCLQKMAQCVLWFHPLIWMSAGRACLVREFVCDDAATHCAASTASYLRTLLRIAEQRNNAHGGLLTIGRSASEVRLRAERLALADRLPTLPTLPIAPITVLIMGLAAVVASQFWLPTNPLISARSTRSAWPTWSAATLHAMNLSVRDFEPFDEQSKFYELQEHATEAGNRPD